MNNNNNNEPHRFLGIESLDDWIQRRGILSSSGSHDDNDDVEPTLDQVQDTNRQRALQAYESARHAHYFQQDDDQDRESQQLRQEALEKLKGWTVTIETAENEFVTNVPLQPLAAVCEMVFALATTGTDALFHTETIDHTLHTLNLSLQSFRKRSVQDFLLLIMKDCTVLDLTTTTTTASDCSESTIVDVCQIAHYLQNNRLVQETAAILVQAVDTSNCYSMCQLADQLQLHELFEKSLHVMLHSVQDLEQSSSSSPSSSSPSSSSSSSNNDQEYFLSPELRHRITLLKKALETSVQDHRAVYFSSLDEYLAIFAERVDYYRERLEVARQEASSSSTSIHVQRDTQAKIQKQQVRLRTLETVYREQKVIFGKNKKR